MEIKSLQAFFAYILLILSAVGMGMATSVHRYLGTSKPFFEAEARSRILPESHPALSAPEEAIPENSAVLKKVYQKAAEIHSLSSLLIHKEGRLIIEDYFQEMDADQAVNIKSASKSIMSLLIGIALDRGILQSITQPIQEFFPEYMNSETDPAKLAITIEDLLTMRAGLKSTSFYNYSRWVNSRNWVRYVLEQPLVEEPGGQMIYSTGSSHLLSVILTKASGMTTREFARRYLFDPLDIELETWYRDPQGYYTGGNNMFMKPSDMIKIGQMVLNGGVYEGKRIVPEQWLLKSLKTYTQSDHSSNYYGYMWWKQEIGGYQALFACGYGGQYIFMFPELESIVVMTSFLEYANELREYDKPIFKLLEETVIPLILESEPGPARGMPHPRETGRTVITR